MDDFDFIVIGGGSAGCVVANRLSADPAVRVCLVEGGPSDRGLPTRLKVDTPAGNPFLLEDARFNWRHVLAADPRTGGRDIPAPRGKLLGGSSAVNGMIYIRGHRSDYDAWEAAGNSGWGWRDVLPAFLTHENHHGPQTTLHASGGELHVQKLRQFHAASAAFVEAATQLQFPHNSDFNGPEMDGFGAFEVTQRNGERWSSARAFLHPVMQRPNLTVLTGALACALRFEGRRAAGLTIRHHGRERVLTARREIVLCGGAFASPQLLMLSGVGPAARLRALGIDIVHDLPGVGANLQDHASVPMTLMDRSNTAYALAWKRSPHLVAEFFRYLLARRGTLASNVVEAGGFIRTRADLPAPDVQYVFLAALRNASSTLPRGHGFVITPVLLRPASRGHLELASPDPAAKPIVQANQLSDDQDLRTLVAGMKILRQIVSAPAFGRFRGAELLPGDMVRTDDELAAFIHSAVTTAYHPVGTCMMGPQDEPMAVVDAQLRVRGVQGLRVADCSIMPTIVSGNTNAPAMMIGERAASFILQGNA